MRDLISIDKNKALKFIFISCLAIEFFIVISDITLNHFRWIPDRSARQIFNMALESSISNLFSSFLALVVGIVAFLNSLYLAGKKKCGWIVLALFFIYMGIDDGTMIHEKFTTSLLPIFLDITGFDKSNYASFSWHLVFIPFFALMGLFIVYFSYKELRSKSYWYYPYLGLVCFTSAVAIDYFEGINITIKCFVFHALKKKISLTFFMSRKNLLKC